MNTNKKGMASFAMFRPDKFKISNVKKIEVRLRGNITDCMQMRIKRVNGIELFECGIDIITSSRGEHLVTSTIGICNRSLLGFVEYFLYYRIDDSEAESIEYICLTDDPIYDDRENKIIDSKELLMRFEEYGSCK